MSMGQEVLNVQIDQKEEMTLRAKEQKEWKRKGEREMEGISQNPSHYLVSSGSPFSTPSTKASPITQNPMLSALLFSKKLPSKEKKSLTEPLPDLKYYLDHLEAYAQKTLCPPLVEMFENNSDLQQEPQMESSKTNTVSGSFKTISDPAEITLTLSQSLVNSNELEQAFSDLENLTQSFLGTIFSTMPPNNLDQSSSTACELSSNSHLQQELYTTHEDMVAPEHTLGLCDLIQKDSSLPLLHIPDGMTLFSPESSGEPMGPDTSLYADDMFNSQQSEDTGSVQSHHTEMFDLSLMSDAVELQSSPFPTLETEINSLQLAGNSLQMEETFPNDLQPSAKPLIRTSSSSKSKLGRKQVRTSHRGPRTFSTCLDEQRARALRLPLSVNDIINLSVNAFNEIISANKLNQAQLSLIKDIRKRGKNKMAAQSCRKRKLDSLVDLEEAVKALREESEQGMREKESNGQALLHAKEKLNSLYSEVFSKLRDEHGNSYSPSEYMLKQSTEGQIYLLPRGQRVSKCT